MEVLPRSILNRIILDNFNDEDILSAKDTLHSHVSTTLKHRRIKRQEADKAKHNVDDILKILDEVDPDAIPIYVAHDLGKLPTIDFNHVDMSTLSREITTCKSKLYDTELSHKTLVDSVSELSTQITTLVSSLLPVLSSLNVTPAATTSASTSSPTPAIREMSPKSAVSTSSKVRSAPKATAPSNMATISSRSVVSSSPIISSRSAVSSSPTTTSSRSAVSTTGTSL